MSISPSVIDTPPELPLPSMITLPLPLGRMLISPLDADTISLPLTSKSPPSWGELSDTTSDKPPAADIKFVTRKDVKYVKFTVKKRNNTVRKTSAPLAGFKRIRSSNGDVEKRPYIKTDILMDGITKNIELPLTDRGPMDYTMLIGRKALGRRWMVNPSISFMTKPKGN